MKETMRRRTGGASLFGRKTDQKYHRAKRGSSQQVHISFTLS